MQIVIAVSRILKLQFIRRYFSTGYIVYIVKFNFNCSKVCRGKNYLKFDLDGFLSKVWILK